ncbi:MAG: NAD(P)/FAD-dependent oxidoreductase [Nocardioidaceae bacterium]
MTRVDTVVIGAGHAGLAVSHLLSRAGRDHVVLDRGRIAERWRSERWGSLHLLTPRWMTRLPGWQYSGPDQDGFMPRDELVQHLERYAELCPVELGAEVREVSPHGDGYRVATEGRSWQARHVVIATGPTGRPHLPATIERLDPDIQLVTTSQYRNPQQFSPGGVLVVGASASGAQIADELGRSGRRVVLAAGHHTRMPRRYRGMDVFWWLEQTGRMARTIDDVPQVGAARREPSLQIAGRATSDPRGTDVDLRSLQAAGVELAGRLDGVDRHYVELRQDLPTTTCHADVRMHGFLDAVDRYVEANHLTAEMEPPVRPSPVSVHRTPNRMDLRAEGIGTVLLATGFRPHHPWLQVPVTDAAGAIRQVRGLTPAAGLYVVGQRFQHRRDATFIDGARHDAHDVVSHLCRGCVTAANAMEAP